MSCLCALWRSFAHRVGSHKSKALVFVQGAQPCERSSEAPGRSRSCRLGRLRSRLHRHLLPAIDDLAKQLRGAFSIVNR